VRFSKAALRRSKGIQQATAVSSGVYAKAADLAALETAARDFSFLTRQPIRSLLSGRHGSRVRGRGLAFEELRLYVPGDDTRTMDWRVTARTGKPYVRVYTEEKDRPCLFLVDQRINMFFGTKRSMKSVAAAEIAALGAWRALHDDDRVGGLVFNDGRIDDVRPHRSREAVMRLLETIAAQNGELRSDSGVPRTPSQLDAALDAAARAAGHGYLVVVVSDFDGQSAATRDLLLRLSLHNDVIAILVYDPFLVNLPPSGDLVVSNGELQVELGLERGRTRQSLLDFSSERGKEILSWQSDIGVPVLPISAAEETAPQLRRLLGLAAASRRQR
jgi:uncharacterized protein (DUF58 family)